MYKNIYNLILCLLFSCVSIFAAASGDDPVDPFIAGQNQFSWNLMQALGEPKGEEPKNNVCFSPYNISSALQLAYFGADGVTKTEIAETLHLPMMAPTSLVAKVSEIENALSQNVSNARALAVDTSFLPAEPYLAVVRDGLKANIFDVDFRRKSKEALESINSWASEKTHGHITKLLEANDVKPSTRLILLSAIYLKAAWLDPFKPENTKDAPFKALGVTEMQVPLMYQKEHMSLYQDKDVQVVFRPCHREVNGTARGPDLETIIVLPRENVSFQQVYKGFSSEQLAKWEQSSANEYVELYLPKCSLRQRVSLKKPLQSMGMKQAFSNAANFTRLSPGLELAIDDVFHEAYMQLDEAGIEAAAATAVVMVMKSVAPTTKKPIEVRCDRPFFVIIRERTSGLVLFISFVANPQKIVKS